MVAECGTGCLFDSRQRLLWVLWDCGREARQWGEAVGNAPAPAPVDAAAPGRVVPGLSPRPEGGVPVPEGDSSTIPQDCPSDAPHRVTERVVIL